jgi:hypothetical protein
MSTSGNRRSATAPGFVRSSGRPVDRIDDQIHLFAAGANTRSVLRTAAGRGNLAEYAIAGRVTELSLTLEVIDVDHQDTEPAVRQGWRAHGG